ncbi:MAG: alpha/beta hydrolase [Chryseolinea sp.]
MSILFSRQRGKGKALIFIHGFPMHQAIWDDFGEKFIEKYTVISIDLPGFGKSQALPENFSLDDVADEVIAFVLAHKLSDSVLVGHSLGGYVALYVLEKRPDLFSKLILFHSTAYADTNERKASRNKVIDFVKKNGAIAFTSSFIEPLFADPQHEGIERVRQIAATTSAETVIGYTKAMRDRREQLKTLISFEKPTLLLGGEKDQGIPVESLKEQANSSQKAQIHILQNVAHMGMFESAGEAVTRIKEFLEEN